MITQLSLVILGNSFKNAGFEFTINNFELCHDFVASPSRTLLTSDELMIPIQKRAVFSNGGTICNLDSTMQLINFLKMTRSALAF
jgi:hypothetical protein